MSSLSRAGAALVRGCAALVAVALASTLTTTSAEAGTSASRSPAGRGATWLAGQLDQGLIHNDQFNVDDYGLTADTVFALKALGGHRTDVRQARHALAAHVGDYTGTGSERYAGATAKLAVLAEQTGADPRNFGGVNLIHRLAGLVTPTGPAAGRIADQSQFGDFANTIGQILAVRALTDAKSGMAGKARAFLLEQQCRQGYFRLDFSKPASAHQGCGQRSPADPDATSYAVVQLWKESKGRPALRSALRNALHWLATQQRANGSFEGGTSTAAPNTNSTGLAGWALGLAGRCRAARAAAGWVATLQVAGPVAGTPLAGQQGAIAYDRTALRAARHAGITTAVQDQWRRATAQAAPALLFLHGC
jgi:hypothetical protein